jgi:hypothetical protein
MKWFLGVALAALPLFLASTVSRAETLVIRVQKAEELRYGMFLVTMENGDAVSIDGKNIDFGASTVTSTEHKFLKASPSVPKSAAADIIRKHCADKWPTNFEMQKFCVDEQTKAYNELNR